MTSFNLRHLVHIELFAAEPISFSSAATHTATQHSGVTSHISARRWPWWVEVREVEDRRKEGNVNVQDAKENVKLFHDVF